MAAPWEEHLSRSIDARLAAGKLSGIYKFLLTFLKKGSSIQK